MLHPVRKRGRPRKVREAVDAGFVEGPSQIVDEVEKTVVAEPVSAKKLPKSVLDLYKWTPLEELPAKRARRGSSKADVECLDKENIEMKKKKTYGKRKEKIDIVEKLTIEKQIESNIIANNDITDIKNDSSSIIELHLKLENNTSLIPMENPDLVLDNNNSLKAINSVVSKVIDNLFLETVNETSSNSSLGKNTTDLAENSTSVFESKLPADLSSKSLADSPSKTLTTSPKMEVDSSPCKNITDLAQKLTSVIESKLSADVPTKSPTNSPFKLPADSPSKTLTTSPKVEVDSSPRKNTTDLAQKLTSVFESKLPADLPSKSSSKSPSKSPFKSQSKSKKNVYSSPKKPYIFKEVKDEINAADINTQYSSLQMQIKHLMTDIYRKWIPNPNRNLICNSATHSCEYTDKIEELLSSLEKRVQTLIPGSLNEDFKRPSQFVKNSGNLYLIYSKIIEKHHLYNKSNLVLKHINKMEEESIDLLPNEELSKRVLSIVDGDDNLVQNHLNYIKHIKSISNVDTAQSRIIFDEVNSENVDNTSQDETNKRISKLSKKSPANIMKLNMSIGEFVETIDTPMEPNEAACLIKLYNNSLSESSAFGKRKICDKLINNIMEQSKGSIMNHTSSENKISPELKLNNSDSDAILSHIAAYKQNKEMKDFLLNHSIQSISKMDTSLETPNLLPNSEKIPETKDDLDELILDFFKDIRSKDISSSLVDGMKEFISLKEIGSDRKLKSEILKLIIKSYNVNNSLDLYKCI